MTEASWRTRVRPILLHPRLPRALTATGPDGGGGPELPELDLPGRLWVGAPEPFVRALRERFGVDAALLGLVSLHEDDHHVHATIAFVVRDPSAPPAGWRWTAAPETFGAGRLPWRDPAWLPAAQDWIATTLARLDRPLSAPVEQVRVGALSCVLRAPTPDGDVYFKATVPSPLFVDEGTVMVVLSDLFPEHVPAPLAVDTARRWMLLPDLGPAIGWAAPVAIRERALGTFARLQVRSAGSVDRLLAAGCLDRRLAWLARQASDWLPTVDLSPWMSDQDGARLRAAAPSLARLCARLDELALPATLGHGDLHLDNVARGFVFFDWSDASVIHPFVDMIDVYAHAADADRERLRDAYLAEWASFAPRDRLLRAWRLAEPLAALNQVVSYVSLASRLEPGPDGDGLGPQTAKWLRRLLDVADL